MSTYIDGLDKYEVSKTIAQIKEKSTFFDNFSYDADPKFVLWMFLVNRRIVHKFGIGIFDVPDRNWYDSFEAGVSPKEMAEDVYQEEMDELGFFYD